MSDVVIKISGDAKDFQEALDKAKGQTEELSGQLENTAKTAGIAFAALTAEIGLSTLAFADSEKATIKLEQALRNQGLASSGLLQNYKNQAQELERLTGIHDGATKSGLALLQSFIGQRAITPELTRAVADLSTQTGDFGTAAEIIGRAVNGNIKGLKQFSITVNENADSHARLAEIIDKVNQKFGGQAEAAVQGIGSIALLKAAFDELQKAIGKDLAPTIEKVTRGLTDLYNFIADNPALVGLITDALLAGTAITGLVTAAAAAGFAIVGLRAALIAAKIEMTAATIAAGAMYLALTAGLIVVVAEVYKNWDTVWPRMRQIFQGFVEGVVGLASGLGTVFNGLFHFNISDMQKGIEQIKAALINAYETEFKDIKIPSPEIDTSARDAKAKQAADRAQAEKNRQDAARIAANRATTEALQLEAENGSSELIKLKREEAALLNQIREENNAQNREYLQEKLNNTRELEAQAHDASLAQSDEFDKEVFGQNAEFQALDEQQRADFLLKNRAALQASLLTETQARQQAALQRAQLQAKEHNDYLLAQQKFGNAYATINKLMHSEIFQGSKQAFGELAQLQQSSNSTLKGIGKVAAIANIVIKTAESAMNIYAGFSTIPIIGPVLGVAGAAAAVAFGAEQVGTVSAAADGGIMTGGIRGVDSIPTMTMPGELVVPTRNFDEVINAVAAERSGNVGHGGGGVYDVVLTLKDQLVEFVEAKIIERQRLGISNLRFA